MSLPVALTSEIQKLAPSAIIELFILDATSLGGDVLRFHAGTNGLSQNIVWQGETYIRYPVSASGFEFDGQGQFPRPKLQVSNILSAITQVVLQYNDLLGAKLTRKRTMAKFLDAVNFDGGVNANADDTAEFAEDIYYVDRKSGEDKDVVEFELAASVDLVGVNLPRRQVIQNICIWKYRGAECGYTGFPLWDQNDVEATTATTTEGQALIDARLAYLASLDTLATSQAALDAAGSTKGPACDIVLAETQYAYTIGTGVPTYGVAVKSDGTQKNYWNGSLVSLGATYRTGNLKVNRDPVEAGGGTFTEYYTVYEIQRWAVDTVACSAADTAYSAAVTARDTAQTDSDNALNDLNTAFASLPSNDPLYTRDVCGKRLSSCKLRFGENNPLSFGSFPAAALDK